MIILLLIYSKWDIPTNKYYKKLVFTFFKSNFKQIEIKKSFLNFLIKI